VISEQRGKLYQQSNAADNRLAGRCRVGEGIEKLSKRRWSAVEWKNLAPLPRHSVAALSHL
jgi:hypothetical protein